MAKNTGLVTFIDSMLPSFERTIIEKELERLFKQMEELVLPATEIGDQVISRSKTYGILERELKRNGNAFKGRPSFYVNSVVAKVVDEQRDLFSLIEKIFSKEVEREGLDYKRAHLLHFISLLEFFNDYCMKFYLSATKEIMENEYHPVDKEEKHFAQDHNNAIKFAHILKALEKGFKGIDKALEPVKGTHVDLDDVELFEAMAGADADPLKVGFYTVDYSPFYLVGKVYNAIYVWLFEYKKHQRDKLEQHVAFLNRKKASGDIKDMKNIEEVISHHSNRLNRLNAEIEEELDNARN